MMLSRQPQVDWAKVELPDAWPDEMSWRRPLKTLRLLMRAWCGALKRVELPAGLPGAERIPKYALLEFHNLPNGNYSKVISRGYARWFDRVMLGTLQTGRARLAQALRGSCCVLDLGCGAGHTAGAVQANGVAQVYGLDLSPYLLQLAATTYPQVQWIQAPAEQTGLPDASFDGVSVCFLFHEIAPRYLPALLTELRRITRPGAKLAVLEPSALQWHGSWRELGRRFGWRGLYFKALALRAFEPFTQAWHQQDFRARLAEHGFKVIVDESACPFRYVLAQRER